MQSIGYSHIYIEREAIGYPDTLRVTGCFPEAQIVYIERYGDLFHRPRQQFQLQKRSPKLIVAVAHGRLIYESDERIESFGEGVIYYNAQLRNCVYNCQYCFLQGMHGSGNTVAFVNHEDFAEAARDLALRHGGYWLSISYLSDLLGFEEVIPFCRRWIEFARRNRTITIEIRTKCDNMRALADLHPPENVVLVWSLTPAPLAQRYEHGTASFANRLFAAATAARSGWRLRLCFDPVLLVDGWRQLYADCFRETLHRIPEERIEKISFGLFRMHPNFLKKVRRLHPTSDLLAHSFERRDGIASHSAEMVDEACEFVRSTLGAGLPAKKVVFVHG